MEVQKRHSRSRKGAFHPKPDGPIELQLSVLDKFGDFPTGDAEDAVGAKFEKVAVSRLSPLRSRNPPDPNVGVQQNHCKASQSLATGSNTELENRISKAPARGRRRSRGFRDDQYFNRLDRLKWETLQNEFAMLTDCSLSPVCLHALGIEGLIVRCGGRRLSGALPYPTSARHTIHDFSHNGKRTRRRKTSYLLISMRSSRRE
jgi:hypothetical protein